MTARVIITHESGFPTGIPGDAYYSYSEDGLTLPAGLMQSAYQGSTFSATLQFQVVDEINSTETETVWINADDASALTEVSQFGLSWSSVNAYTLRLSGTANNVFTDEFYKFLLKDLKVVTLPVINNEEYLSVVEYHAPDIKHTEKTYNFSINGGADAYTVTQNFYWNYSVSISTFTQSVAKGIK